MKTGSRRRVPEQHRDYARAMRADSTKAENMLWQAIRNKQLHGFKFKRQVPIGRYIVDFVCFERKLIVEVDGGQHADSFSDRARDAWLQDQGFCVLRFWNNDVLKSADAHGHSRCRRERRSRHLQRARRTQLISRILGRRRRVSAPAPYFLPPLITDGSSAPVKTPLTKP